VSSGSPWIAAANIVVAISFVFIFLYSFVRGRYAKFTPVDKISLIVGLLTVTVWKLTGDAITAQLILQVAVMISFLPTIVGLFQGNLRERPLPWFIGVLSYFFVTAAVLVQSGISNWPALVYPLIVGVGINGLIGFLAIAQDKEYLKVPTKI
jgi:hypothetical protein